MLTILNLMEKRKGTITFVGGIIVGLIIGLIFAWLIWPVQWRNGTPGHLRSDFQRYYLNAVADEYSLDRNTEAAREKLGLNLAAKSSPWVKKPEALQEALTSAIANAGTEEHVTALGRLAQDLEVNIDTAQITPVAPVVTPETEQKGISWLTILGLLLIVMALVAAAFYILTRINAQRQGQLSKPEGARAGAYGTMAPTEEGIETVEGEAGPPVSSFVATYMLGDDYFDPSFSIEVGTDFLGECGVGISESIGVGDPKKVTALEAWLFDKSDIRTVTAVMASEYAYNDPTLNAKLSAKGEIMPIRPGLETTLETTALHVSVKVKELEYAQGDLPTNSFYQRVSIELRAWVKSSEKA
ncbi:MAG: hypothetical protein RBT47_03085 [Anaerolineae bacterium]|jgi:hypothetical protein|nr:hypothetical protein [Anaerolineae bacterium]